MKKILIILFTLISTICYSRNYYINGSTGNDGNSGTITLPWKTLSKITSFSSSFAAGDSILLQSGQTFYGTIKMGKSGSTSLPIIFGTYGGITPALISGFTTLTGWNNSGGGIWNVNIPGVSTGLRVILMDGVIQRLGRFPNYDASNGGWLSYETWDTTSGVRSITDNQLASTPNWKDALVAIRKTHWIIDADTIKNHIGTRLVYTNPIDVVGKVNGYPGKNNFGYFIEDDIRTLDQDGEWFLNKTSLNLSMYFNLDPSVHVLKASTIDTLVNTGSTTNLTFTNLSFEGANKIAISNRFGQNIVVKNCKFDNNYNDVVLKSITNPTIDNNTMNHTINDAINTSDNGSTAIIITNNYIKNVGLFAGMGGSGDDTYSPILQNGNNATIQYNILDSIGHGGIVFKGNNMFIRYNYITNYCITKDDNGAIYNSADPSDDGSSFVTHSNIDISFNILVNGVGAFLGTESNTHDANGIYMDAGANGAYIHDNTVVDNLNGEAVLMNGSSNLRITNNIFYNARTVAEATRQLHLSPQVRNIIYTSNISYPTVSNLFYYQSQLNTPSTITIQQDMRNAFIKIDSNLYRSDLDLANPFIYTYALVANGSTTTITDNLSQWQTYIAGEANSSLISRNTSRVDYNSTNSFLLILFPGLSFTDVKTGIIYTDSRMLDPYTGSVMTSNGSVVTHKYYLRKS